MPFRVELEYMPDVPQAPARITQCRDQLKGDYYCKNVGDKENVEVDFFIDIPLTRSQEQSFKALMLVSDPSEGAEFWDVIDLALEATFLAGIEYAKKTGAK